MLKKRHRGGSRLFDFIMKNGKGLHGSHLGLRFIDCSISSCPDGLVIDKSFSFAPSSKLFKRAVDRNLLKRRGRHIASEIIGEVKPSFAGVIFFKQGALGVPFSEMRDEMTSLLKKAKVL